MPRKWTNKNQPAGGYRLVDLENEMHRRWVSRQRWELERQPGPAPLDDANPFTTQTGGSQ